MTAHALAKQFKEGTHYPGFGCFGDGTYCDSNKGLDNVASSYAGGGGGHGYGGSGGGEVIRIALPKTAKIAEVADLQKLVGDAPDKFREEYGKGSGPHSENDGWLGVQASLAGYDAIHVGGSSKSRHSYYGEGFYVILNRGAVTVQKEDAKGHRIK